MKWTARGVDGHYYNIGIYGDVLAAAEACDEYIDDVIVELFVNEYEG